MWDNARNHRAEEGNGILAPPRQAGLTFREGTSNTQHHWGPSRHRWRSLMSSRKKRVANSQLCMSQIASWNFLTALTLLPSTRYLKSQEPKAGNTERISRILSTCKRPGAFPASSLSLRITLQEGHAVSILQIRRLRLWKNEL